MITCPVLNYNPATKCLIYYINNCNVYFVELFDLWYFKVQLSLTYLSI